ncbi:hypothetical protein ACIBO2_02015 [Nonomuraea sp. NPDC050022]|uniref:hypothetical protein n=1 Tax=unclassified Nonomuraea TaxID=2593643 RepID=UPI0033F39B30
MVREFSLATAARLFSPLILLAPVCLMLPGSHVAWGLAAAGMAIPAIGVRLARHRQMAADTVVRFSAQGVEMEDAYGSRLRLAWRHIERVDVVESRVPSPRTIAEADRIYVRTGTRKCIGVVGWGEYEISPSAPGWLLCHLERMPVDPVTGLQKLSIPLGVVDPLWEHGPMGDRVRHHRPDLLAGDQLRVSVGGGSRL